MPGPLVFGKWKVRIAKGKAVAAAQPGTRRLVIDASRKVLNSAIRQTPVDTGLLRAANQLRVTEPGLKVRGEVFNNTKYALAVHDGTGPHVIKARKKKALKFTVGGRTVYATSVRHPGTRPRPFLSDALRFSLSTLDGWRINVGNRGFDAEGFDDRFDI